MQEASDVLSFLRNVLARGGPVEDVVTHASHLLIGRERVFKLKRPVSYAYLDYSSAQLRLNACQQEFRLNAKTAPSLYLGAHAVTQTGRGYEIDGQGELVDAFVEMRRFPQECLLDEVVARGELTRPLLSALAESIARMRKPPRSSRGTHCVLSVSSTSTRRLSSQLA